jgi:hypothetical protein
MKFRGENSYKVDHIYRQLSVIHWYLSEISLVYFWISGFWLFFSLVSLPLCFRPPLYRYLIAFSCRCENGAFVWCKRDTQKRERRKEDQLTKISPFFLSPTSFISRFNL